jgi:hypothetical protein
VDGRNKSGHDDFPGAYLFHIYGPKPQLPMRGTAWPHGAAGRAQILGSAALEPRAGHKQVLAALSGVRIENNSPRLSRSAVRPSGDFHVLIKHGEHAHEALHGKALIVAAEDVRQVGLLDADQLGSRYLCQLARLDEPLKLNNESGLKLMFLSVGEAEVSKNVATADFVGGQSLLGHALASLVAL